MTAIPARLLDQLLIEADTALRVIAAPAQAAAALAPGDDSALTATDKAEAAAMMRVNHAGEIAAQALYRGQALLCREPELRTALLQAASEEHEHLAWCQQRVRHLGEQTSRLAPAWYAGSFTIGLLAGLAGDRFSLGFLAETERQVTDHLNSHLETLPQRDAASRQIVERMRDDEIAHGEDAVRRGGTPMPAPVRQLMRAAAKVMTTLAHRI